jgi:ubiquinone/menaquinone biosynthesis C-methylase UbiE
MARKLKKDEVIDGRLAYWYAKNTKADMDEYKKFAKKVAENIRESDRVLEVAPGPGYTVIELAKLGNYSITGMDLSFVFTEIGEKNARQAGVNVTFRQGNVSSMPFENESFDFILNRAAFKNFLDPVAALKEMCRVLKKDGKVLIDDFNPNATYKEIKNYVNNMRLNWFDKLVNKLIFNFGLRKTAHSKEEFENFIAQTDFKSYKIIESPLSYDIWLYK